jgi:hypothetical protein
MNKLLLVLVFILSACGAMPQGIAAPMSTQARVLGTATVASTPTVDSAATIVIMGTALVSAQEAEREAQLEIDALERMNVDATITHEANDMAIAIITQRVYETTVSGTQTSIPLTVTAFPVVATMEANQIKRESAQMTNIASQPTLEWARARADKADEMVAIDLIVRIAFATLILSFALACMFFIWWGWQKNEREKAEETEEETSQPIGFEPIPMAQVNPTNPNETIRAELPCTVEQIVILADGIVKDKLTLAFRQWVGTPVYPVLKDVRQFFKDHLFSYPLAGKGGELEFTTAGREFLEDIVTQREPPAPYVCREKEIT